MDRTTLILRCPEVVLDCSMHAQTSGVHLLMVGEHSMVVFLHALSAMASLRSSRPDATGALTGLRELITLMLASRRLPAQERSRIGRAAFATAKTLSSMLQGGKEKSTKYLFREGCSLVMNQSIYQSQKSLDIQGIRLRSSYIWCVERGENKEQPRIPAKVFTRVSHASFLLTNIIPALFFK